jgi:[protein-PII] uridylyltransferase
MRQLYLDTKRALRRGLENPVDKQDLIDETQQAALRRLIRKGLSEERVRELWRDMGEDYFLRESYQDIVWQTAALDKHEPGNALVLVGAQTGKVFEGATQIYLRTKDRPYIFAAVASLLDHLNLSIQDARVYRSESGYTIDTFYVLDHNGTPIGNDNERLQRIKRALQQELSLKEDFTTTIQRRTPRQLKHFAMPTRTTINNDIFQQHTMLEVISPDRPGLLACIGRIFMQFGINLQNAKISTLGERVEDIFYITDANGQALSDPHLCTQLQEEICRQLDQRVQKEQTH